MSTDQITIKTAHRQLISPNQAWHYTILPKEKSAKHFEFYISEHEDSIQVKEELELLFNTAIVLHPKDSKTINDLLVRYYPKNTKVSDYQTSDDPDFLNKIFTEAINLNTSDIHLEVLEEQCRVRVRIDGRLVERYIIPKDEYTGIVNKVKIKANLDIAEKRLPQDGRIHFREGNSNLDLRISVIPTMFGEKIVIRLLDKRSSGIEIDQLGFDANQLDAYRQGVKKTHGIILISGPTGSGKTTTLYATLKMLNQVSHNILTIEDPVEYTLEGVNQVQLRENIGLGYTQALKSFLRQDPDIIMIGEIRDCDTAEIAIRSALTGHLVLSTIHTNTAIGIIPRLIDMGIPPYLIESTLNLAVAQRLLRLLCPHCKTETAFSETVLPVSFKLPHRVEKHYTASGCEQCLFTGYSGRKAIYEVIPITQSFTGKHTDFTDLDKKLDRSKYPRLASKAFDLFSSGLTSADEIYPVLLDDNN